MAITGVYACLHPARVNTMARAASSRMARVSVASQRPERVSSTETAGAAGGFGSIGSIDPRAAQRLRTGYGSGRWSPAAAGDGGCRLNSLMVPEFEGEGQGCGARSTLLFHPTNNIGP